MTSWLPSIKALGLSLVVAGCTSSTPSSSFRNMDGKGSAYQDGGYSQSVPAKASDSSFFPLDAFVAEDADAENQQDLSASSDSNDPSPDTETDPDAGPDRRYLPLDLNCELPADPVELDWSQGAGALFDLHALPVYEIAVDETEWALFCAQVLEEAVTDDPDIPGTDSRPYTRARVTISGNEVPVEVGLRFRGRSSYLQGVGTLEDCASQEFRRKPNFKISFNRFSPGFRFLDLKKINLIGGNSEQTLGVSEIFYAKIASFLLVPHPRTNHAVACLNGRYLGVFAHQEEVDDQPFLEHHFESPDGPYYKCDGQCSLAYPDSSADYFREKYEPVAGTPETMEELQDFLRGVNLPNRDSFDDFVEQHIDVDNWLYNLALELFLMDYDGLFSSGNNALVYGSPEGAGGTSYRWSMVRHDTDGAFGDDPEDWNGERGLRSLCFTTGSGGNHNNPDGTIARDSYNEEYTVNSARYPVLAARLLWDTHRSRYRDLARQVSDIISAEYASFFDGRLAALEPWIGAEGAAGSDPYYDDGYEAFVSRISRLGEELELLRETWGEELSRDDFEKQYCSE